MLSVPYWISELEVLGFCKTLIVTNIIIPPNHFIHSHNSVISAKDAPDRWWIRPATPKALEKILSQESEKMEALAHALESQYSDFVDKVYKKDNGFDDEYSKVQGGRAQTMEDFTEEFVFCTRGQPLIASGKESLLSSDSFLC